ncbi:peptidoglycan-recognition protein SC2-like [Branchiostoma lanceolatum]|uniref:peptidoglycan-recognition protein SC2-like n=1 Tax=Branchiostoma lanceolatum TaxID=7740 RepID=UPI003453A6A4
MATKGLVILFCLLSYAAAQRWRSDGRCGPNYPAPDANPGECNPNAVDHCCSEWGWCGRETTHCICSRCVDYSLTAGGSSSGGSTSLVTSGSCPRIVTKSEWGSRATNWNVMLNLPVPKVVIHHSAGATCSTQSTCSAQVRNIQSYHMDGRGYSDIGYNFLVGNDGNVYEGRGWDRRGAHALNVNSESIGICFMGDFTGQKPTAAAIAAAKSLISCGVSLGKIRSAYSLYGHRDVGSTACPGNLLYDDVKSWGRYVG